MSLELLEEYIQAGNTAELRQLLHVAPELAVKKTSYQVSPLMLACYLKKTDVARVLAQFVEPDIFEASALGQFDIVANQIYKHPGIINTFSEDGFTPLGLACYFGHEDVARYLLLKGADVNVPSRNGYNVFPLHSAVAANDLDITKILLEAGAFVNIVQQAGITPLHSAAQHGNIEMLILLLEAGADVSARTEDGRTPSQVAAEKGFQEIAKILI